MNQDGLENFFGCIKSCCQAPNSPIATEYRTAYGTTIINNINSSSSKGSNCEPDSCVPLLNNVDEYIFNYVSEPKQSQPKDSLPKENITETYEIEAEDDVMNSIIFDPQISESDLNFVEDEAMVLTSSLICKKVLETTNCESCISNLQAPSLQDDHTIINSSESIDQLVSFPSVIFMRTLKQVLPIVYELIPHVCTQIKVRDQILHFLKDIDIESIGCPDHNIEIVDKIKVCSVKYALMSYCKNINELLRGKIPILPDNFDCIQGLAHEYYMKNKRIGKHSDIFTN